jgi:hypothetical protein
MTRRVPAPLRFAPPALLALALAACASEALYDVDFDDSAGIIEIVALGDGNVLVDGHSRPFDAALQALQQRVDAMPGDVRKCVVVQLVARPVDGGDATAARVRADINRLLDHLLAMKLKQVRLL